MKGDPPKIGMIGGLSYISSSFYYKQINKKYNQKRGRFFTPEIIMLSLCFEDIVEGLKNNQNLIILKLRQAFEVLVNQNVDIAIMPCNTLHKYLEEIMVVNELNFIHILKPVTEKLLQNNIKKIGLLGTSYTMEEKFHLNYFRENNILPVVPSSVVRKSLNKMIFKYLCYDVMHEDVINVVMDALKEFKNNNVTNIVLACSELFLILNNKRLNDFIRNEGVTLWDTSTMHVDYISNMAVNSIDGGNWCEFNKA